MGHCCRNFGIIFILRLIGKSAFFQKLVSSDSNKTTLKRILKTEVKLSSCNILITKDLNLFIKHMKEE